MQFSGFAPGKLCLVADRSWYGSTACRNCLGRPVNPVSFRHQFHADMAGAFPFALFNLGFDAGAPRRLPLVETAGATFFPWSVVMRFEAVASSRFPLLCRPTLEKMRESGARQGESGEQRSEPELWLAFRAKPGTKQLVQGVTIVAGTAAICTRPDSTGACLTPCLHHSYFSSAALAPWPEHRSIRADLNLN